MSNLLILCVIFIASLKLGHIWYESVIRDETEGEKEKLLRDSSSQRKFKDFWTFFVNFFIGGLIGYYFITVRWGHLLDGDSLSFGDFFLVMLFILSMFGHLPILSLNITKGIEAILSKVLDHQVDK